MLKVAWAHEESMHEAAGLRFWDGAGTVRLRAEHHCAHTSAMLLERCVPGMMLADVKSEPEQDLVIAALLQRLWVTAPSDHPFRPLELMCEQWARAFEEAQERSPAPPAPPAPSAPPAPPPPPASPTPPALPPPPTPPTLLDPAIAREGIDLFRALSKTGPRPLLLWTDLHAENVLAAEREPWLAIDPKPYVGDPAYDLVQHMLNCPDRLGDDPRGLARRMAGLTGLDPDRATAWLFARCVQESLDAPNLARVATRLAGEALS